MPFPGSAIKEKKEKNHVTKHRTFTNIIERSITA